MTLLFYLCFKNVTILEKSGFAVLQLVAEFVRENVKTRQRYPQVPRDMCNTIRRVFRIPEVDKQAAAEDLMLQKRKECYLCPSAKHRITKYLCVQSKRANWFLLQRDFISKIISELRCII